MLSSFLVAHSVWAADAPELQALPRYLEPAASSRLDCLWQDCADPLVQRGDYIVGRSHAGIHARWSSGSKAPLDPERTYGPVEQARANLGFRSACIGGWWVNVWQQHDDSSLGIPFARAVTAPQRARPAPGGSEGTYRPDTDRAEVSASVPWTPFEEARQRSWDDVPRDEAHAAGGAWQARSWWEGSTNQQSQPHTPWRGNRRTWEEPEGKRRRTDGGSAGPSGPPPPHNWRAHEVALDRRRDWMTDSRAEDPERCPLSDVLPHFVKHLQKLDKDYATRYRDRWDRYCRASPCYVWGHPTKDPNQKDRAMLRGFVAKLCLTGYFREFEAWHRTGPSAPGPSQGQSSASAASSWERPWQRR